MQLLQRLIRLAHTILRVLAHVLAGAAMEADPDNLHPLLLSHVMTQL
jgi:hypothetical protein